MFVSRLRRHLCCRSRCPWATAARNCREPFRQAHTAGTFAGLAVRRLRTVTGGEIGQLAVKALGRLAGGAGGLPARAIHAGGYRAVLSCGLSGALAVDTEGIGAVRRQVGRGKDHIPGITQGLAAVDGVPVGVMNGHGVACGDGDGAAYAHVGGGCSGFGSSGAVAIAGLAAAALTGEAAGLSAHAAGGTEEQAGLSGFQTYPHAAAASCGQHGAARDGDGAVGVQRLVIGGVGRPDGHRAAGNGQVAVGVEAIAAGGIGIDDAAGDVHGKGVAAQVGVGGVQAVVGGDDADIAGADVQLCRFDALIALGNGDVRAVSARPTDGHDEVAVNGIVSGGDGKDAAFDGQQLLGVDGVVDGGADIQRYIPDGEGCLAVLIGGLAGLDAVFAVGREIQRAAAADGDGGAILALDDGVFRAAVIGVAGVVVPLGVGQGVFRAASRQNGDRCGLAAGDGGGIGAGEGQTLQYQRYANGALFDFDGAVGATAGDGVGARAFDGESGAVNVIAAVPAGDGDAAVREYECGGDIRFIRAAGASPRVRLQRTAGGEGKRHRRSGEEGECLPCFHTNDLLCHYGCDAAAIKAAACRKQFHFPETGSIIAGLPKRNLKEQNFFL